MTLALVGRVRGVFWAPSRLTEGGATWAGQESSSSASEQAGESTQRVGPWWRGGSRAAKTVALGVVGAVLAGVGLGLSDVIKNKAEKGTSSLFAGSSGASLVAHVAAPGTFLSGNPIAPYYVVPSARVASPTDLGSAALNHDRETNETPQLLMG